MFGSDRVDFAMLHKIYGTPAKVELTSEARYSPLRCTGIDIRIIAGDPDPDMRNVSLQS